jgi:hypothetical protein
MAEIIFNTVLFREKFPAFQCNPPLPDVVLQGYFDTATLYINNSTWSRVRCIKTAQLQQLLYLMTAHIAALNVFISTGQTAGIMVSATVDKVTVNLQPPPAENQWQYWLQSTPYGQQLFALLQVIGVGGAYIGGNSAVSSFRRVGWY